MSDDTEPLYIGYKSQQIGEGVTQNDVPLHAVNCQSSKAPLQMVASLMTLCRASKCV